jgi:hypothetical protein
MIAKSSKEREEQIQKSFVRAATSMFGGDRSDTSHLTRIPIDMVTVGESLNGAEHREYVVPLACVCEHCHKMFAEGADTDNVADFIRKYVKVILVTKGDKQILDQEMPLSLFQRFLNPSLLKLRMPPGWDFKSGDPFARFHYAKIEFKLYDDKVNPAV